MSLLVFVDTHTYMNTHTHTYIHIHAHTHTHTHTQVEVMYTDKQMLNERLREVFCCIVMCISLIYTYTCSKVMVV